MARLLIKTGTKLTVRPESRSKDKDFELKCSYEKTIDDVSFLMTIPLIAGKQYLPDPNDELQIVYATSDAAVEIIGFAEDLVKIGPRSFIKIRTVGASRAFNQRADVRIKAELEVKLIKNKYANGLDSDDEYEGVTLDISNGGIAVCTNLTADAGEIIEVRFAKPEKGRRKPLSLRSEICWQRDAPRGSAYRKVFGVKFIFETVTERDRVSAITSELAG